MEMFFKRIKFDEKENKKYIVFWLKEEIHKQECFVFRNSERIIIFIVHSIKAEISNQVQLIGNLSNWWPEEQKLMTWGTKIWK